MRISPVSNYSPNFGRITTYAAAKYMSDNQDNPKALKEFSKAAMEQSLNDNVHVDYHSDLGLYTAGYMGIHGYKSIGSRPTMDIYKAIEDADEANSLEISDKEYEIIQNKKEKINNSASLKVVNKLIDNMIACEDGEEKYEKQAKLLEKISQYCM